VAVYKGGVRVLTHHEEICLVIDVTYNEEICLFIDVTFNEEICLVIDVTAACVKLLDYEGQR
jgi:hypothetical protein